MDVVDVVRQPRIIDVRRRARPLSPRVGARPRNLDELTEPLRRIIGAMGFDEPEAAIRPLLETSNRVEDFVGRHGTDSRRSEGSTDQLGRGRTTTERHVSRDLEGAIE